MFAALKRFAWFWLKSPQRKVVGYKTIWTDILGLTAWLFSKKSKETIWVCVGIKDRTENLKRLVQSLSEINKNKVFALSVHDQGSADAESLADWLKTHWNGALQCNSAAADFSRALAFNKAIQHAEGDLIFVCDADMTVPNDLENQIRKYVTPKTAWFPVCQFQVHENRPEWKWLSAGTGLFAAHRAWHKNALPLDEKFISWGGEDWDLFFRFYKNQICPIRTRCKGLFHHWHKSLKPDDFTSVF